MDIVALTLMPIGMLGFIFGLIAFSKVVRLETQVDHLRALLEERSSKLGEDAPL
ncbi:hypothetical protein [Saccharospirillum sp. MSK14-1]|uniref:hypothetical protein n=1 Tax=Saccharospirillum sp. MSK14-1 TaxID=1897632 RepID=UPI00130503AA|nr:hypothetical protein [Saccharospirillum sp. MSK14-1]